MKILLIFLFLGILLGALYGLCSAITKLFKKNIVVQIINDISFTFFLGYALIFSFNTYNIGVVRLYLLFTIAIGLLLERKTLGKLFAKLYLLIYNVGVKVVKSFRQTQLGKLLFK